MRRSSSVSAQSGRLMPISSSFMPILKSPAVPAHVSTHSNSAPWRVAGAGDHHRHLGLQHVRASPRRRRIADRLGVAAALRSNPPLSAPHVRGHGGHDVVVGLCGAPRRSPAGGTERHGVGARRQWISMIPRLTPSDDRLLCVAAGSRYCSPTPPYLCLHAAPWRRAERAPRAAPPGTRGHVKGRRSLTCLAQANADRSGRAFGPWRLRHRGSRATTPPPCSPIPPGQHAMTAPRAGHAKCDRRPARRVDLLER